MQLITNKLLLLQVAATQYIAVKTPSIGSMEEFI